MSTVAPFVRVLDAPPVLARLYPRAVTSRPDPSADPTRTALEQRGVRVDADRLAAYDRVCGFPLRDDLPPTFPHILGFGAQMALMVTEPFPFRLVGLVHVRQRIEQSRPLRLGEELTVRASAAPVRSHRSGAVVDLVAEVGTGDGEPVWRGVSTYLARGASAPAGAVADDAVDLPMPDAGQPALWRVPADTGRRYAGVSGDVNPIHLSTASARLLGFKRAIAHGMWTAARSLATLDARLPQALTVDVQFAKPLLLGSTVQHVAARDGDGWRTAVRGRGGIPHVVTRVLPG
ncbi:MaoC dehydratase-like protein [Kineococcus xinjiangensis]|uniref:MaoC dehydratase-like protein n=1 Tax=Kineococcus xinjiangensis TaxID=512762 RepID=A0A2S6ID45_9ACTN|nr:MaoC dehydratase-like protein [Kineococcus xinjiangensis]